MRQSRHLLRLVGGRVLIMAKIIMNRLHFLPIISWLEHRDLGDTSLKRYH